MHTLYNAPRHPSGGIAKWPKATVCKTVIRGFKSHSRLSQGTVCPPQRGRTVLCFSRVRAIRAQRGATRFVHFHVHRIVHFWVHPLVHFSGTRTRLPCGFRECCPNGTSPRCAPSAGAGLPFRANLRELWYNSSRRKNEEYGDDIQEKEHMVCPLDWAGRTKRLTNNKGQGNATGQAQGHDRRAVRQAAANSGA